LAGKFFWAHQNPAYLALVYETTIPDTEDRETLKDWGYHFDQKAMVAKGSGAYFAQSAKDPPPKKKGKS